MDKLINNNRPSQLLLKSTSYLLGRLLPLFYFLVAVAFYLRTYDSAQIKITIVQIGGTIFLALWLVKLLEVFPKDVWRRNLWFVLPIILFFVSALLSLTHTAFPIASFKEFIRRMVYFTLAMIIIFEFGNQKRLKSLIFWLELAAFISTFYGIVQYLDRQFFPPPPEPGLDPFIWRQAFGDRIFSTFGNPNFFGDFLAVMSPITLAMFLATRRLSYAILWMMIAFNVLVTYSKGAWLGFSSGLVAFTLIAVNYFTHGKLENVRKILWRMMIVVIILTVIGVGYFTYKRVDSVRFRIYTWLSCFEMIKTHPVIGTGIGTFYLTYPAYRRPQIFHIEGRHNTETDHPENEYLEVFYDEGIIGFGIFLLMLISVLRGGFIALGKIIQAESKHIADIRAYYLLGLISAMIGMLTHNAVCVSLRFVSSGVMLWFLIGAISSLVLNNPLPHQERVGFSESFGSPLIKISPVRRIFQILIVVFAIWAVNIFWGYFQANIYHNIAISYSKQGQWIPALEYYRRVNKLDPGFEMAHYFMGNVYNDRWGPGDADRAIQKYQDLWKIAPDYVQSHYQAGLIYLKWGREELLKAQAEKRPDTFAQQILDKALEQFTLYRYLDPVFPMTYYQMASIYLMRNDYKKAEEMYLATVQRIDPPYKKPVNIEALIQLAALRYSRKDIAGAKGYYQKALEAEPNNVGLLKNAAKFFSEIGDRQKTMELLQRAYQIAPQDPDLQRIFGQAKQP